MDFTVALCLHKLPGAFTRKLLVGGIEQKCLCIPEDPAVFHRSKRGWQFVQVSLRERDEFLGNDTHIVYFSYPDSRKLDVEDKKVWCGKCYLSKPYDMNEDRTNTSTFVGLGTLCLDDIPPEAILEKNGKRYVRFAAKPLPLMDRGNNTHIVFINPDFGTDGGRRQSLNNGFDAPLVEIGRMKETDVSASSAYGTLAGPVSADTPYETTQDIDAPADTQSRTIDGMLF